MRLNTVAKNLFRIIMLYGIFLITASAGAGTEEKSCRIDISSAQAELTPGRIYGEGRLENANWMSAGNNSKYILATISGNADQWTEGGFSFCPSGDGEIKLQLMGPYVQNKTGLRQLPVYYKNITVDGKLLAGGDFEDQKLTEKHWTFSRGSSGMASCYIAGAASEDAGKNCVMACHNSPVSTTLRVQGKKPVEVKFQFKLVSPKFCFVDISSNVNMGFADETANDGKGGWSDQGPENDFRNFDVTADSFGGIPFRIIDPAKNHDKAILTFNNSHALTGLNETRIKVGNAPFPVQYLYLLHTSCWNSLPAKEEIGNIEAVFADGRRESVQVLNEVDIGDWWNARNLSNGKVAVVKDNPTTRVGVFLSKFKLKNLDKVKELIFKTSGKCVWIVVAATLSPHDCEIESKNETFTIKAGSEWKPVNLSETAVLPGSALDFSQFVTNVPAGGYGRVIVNSEGHLAFEKQPDHRVTFFGCSIIQLAKYNSREEIMRMAQMIRRQGYNIVRLHFLDHFLTEKSTKDLEFTPQGLDRLDYWVYCLKQNGIYLYLDAMTSWRGYKKDYPWTPQAEANDFKGRIFFDDAVKTHWKEGVEKLLCHVNPYTGMTLAKDPAVAFILFFNEQEVGLGNRVSPFLAVPWRKWLKDKYKDRETLARAWTDNSGKMLLAANENFENIPLFTLESMSGSTPRAFDSCLFLYEIHKNLLDWYEKTIKELGYGGLTTQYDYMRNLGMQVLRNQLMAVSMHGYHSHPLNYMNTGSIVWQISSISAEAPCFRTMAVTRYGNRPFLITEYGHAFWDRYRYEEGLVMGAYTRLQNTDLIMAHTEPVEDRISLPIYSFSIGRDPVARASQVITWLAFMAGMVKPSPHYVEIELPEKVVFSKGNYAMAVSGPQSKLALVTGLGIATDKGPLPFGLKSIKTDMRLPLFGYSSTINHEGYTEVVDGADASGELASVLQKMKETGLLDKNNRTNPGQGIFESDTAEILLNSPNKYIQVVTPQMEGIASVSPKGIKLCNLSVEYSSVPASIVIAAIDGATLEQSRRLLLVYSTDAYNSGMTFSDNTCRRLEKVGGLPVLMKTGILKLTLKNKNAEKLKVWSLGMNGQRMEKLPVKAVQNELSINVDTSSLTSGISPFFEIAEQ